MSFLAYLLWIIVLLGVGTLVGLVLPTRGTRIGLGAVVFLAFVIDVTWLMAPITGWSVTLVNVVWIGVFASVVLVVALIAKDRRGSFDHDARAWPTTRDLTFLALIVIGFGASLLVLPVPFDTDAQGFGYLALTLRDGGDYRSLAPWHPEIDYLYSPGFTGMIAHLSAHSSLGIHMLLQVFGALTGGLFVWAAYDLGCEWGGARTGRGFMLATLIGTGLITVFLDSHFTALLALIFELAFITFVFRFLQTGYWSSAVFAAICLAGVPLAHQDMTIALIIGYVPWLAVIWLSKPRPSLRIWLGIAAIIPLMALVIVGPWLVSVLYLLASEIKSPYVAKFSHWHVMTITQGGIGLVLVGIGMRIAWQHRHPVLLWMVVWFVGLVEFSTLGLLETIFPGLGGTLFKYNYPLGLAWNGPLILYTVLGGTGLVWLADRIGWDHIERRVGRLIMPAYLLLTITLVAGIVFLYAMLDAHKTRKDVIGCISSAADVDTMLWLRDHTSEDARILNHPGPIEADWAPVISERDTIYFRPQFFFQNTRELEAEQDAFLAFWTNPAKLENETLFREMRVDYVLVPQVFGNPSHPREVTRWIDPLPEAAAYSTVALKNVPYLRLVFERDGAQVYEVVTTSLVRKTQISQ